MTDILTAGAAQPARSTGFIRTERASRYLQQMCKHFAHKLPVTFDPKDGVIPFSIGECRLHADGSELRMDLSAPDHSALTQLKAVMVKHLMRFAFREELAFDWRSA